METSNKAVTKKTQSKDSNSGDWVFTPYIVRNGKRIYPKKAKFFRFPRYVSKKRRNKQ